MNKANKQNKVRVLVVDDEAGCRDFLGILLTEEGFEAITAEDAETAISLLEEGEYDAVITDIMLGGLTGIDLLKHVREKYGDLPVIIITGHSSIDTAVEGLHLGAQDYITKPLGDCRRLLSSVRVSVDQYRREMQQRQMDMKLTEAVEQERQKLGRELHDLLCQDLASISMLSSVVSDNPDSELINKLAKKSVTFVKNLCSGLFPIELEEEGLVSAIQRLVEDQQQMTQMKLELNIEGDINAEDHTKALHFYRIIQEALMNAIKHSEGDHVALTLTADNGTITAIIEDNGRSMPENLDESQGMGLNIMQCRASIIGAVFEIGVAEETGTRIKCSWQKSV
ncbi:hypothetical protein BVX97_02075 [bacterium E08(2017)]|nr:hypothetical protein BVX97_02075 [bacterium E08(2017)]